MRKIGALLLILACAFLIILIGNNFMFVTQKPKQFADVSTTRATVRKFKFLSTSRRKYVTKSLKELGKMDEINPNVLLLNKIPNSGAELLLLLLQKLQGPNNYRHVRLKSVDGNLLNYRQQNNLINNVNLAIRKDAVPLTFDINVHFINFTHFDSQSPTYINIIRNPLNKLESKSKHFCKNCDINNYLNIPYFCGHDPRCSVLGNTWAYKAAKANVEKYYPVVGILEEFNSTLEVFENKLPYFFKNASNIYAEELLAALGKNGKKLSTKNLKIDKTHKKLLEREIEFYEWTKAKLFNDLLIIYGEHNGH